MVDLDFEEDKCLKFHLTGRKNQLLKELANSLGDVEMYRVARELRQVVRELEKCKEE